MIQTSKAYIAFYERYISYFTTSFNKMLMTQLSLPIKNMCDPIESSLERKVPML